MKLQLFLLWVFRDVDCCLLHTDAVKLAAFWCGARPINKALSRSGTLHIWRAWNRLHGTTAWHRLTQQSRHLAGLCERPAPVKQSKPVIRRRHWVWLSDCTSHRHSTCIGLTQNCTGHGQFAPPNTGNIEFCRGVQMLNICNYSIIEAPGGN